MTEQSLQEFNGENLLRLWSERISACRSSGQRVDEWCRDNGFHPSTYYRWQQKIFNPSKKQEKAEFAEISVPWSANRETKAATLRINGQEADVYPGIDVTTLETICRVLKSC